MVALSIGGAPAAAGNPVPVSLADAGTLPSGAATAARQDTGNTSLAAMAAVEGTTSGAAVVTDASGTIQQYLRGLIVKMLALIAQLPASLGGKAPAASLSVTSAVLSCSTVAAGASTTAFGATGAAGDFLSHVILEPAATNAGTTTIFNNATEVYKYTSGTLADLRPIIIPINMLSTGGAWKVTTGTSMQARAFGTFT